jgi:hypothetical protein
MGDDFTLSPPNAEDVARRAAILKHQFVYVACTPPPHLVAEISANWSGVEQKEFESRLEDARKRLVDSLRASGLWD